MSAFTMAGLGETFQIFRLSLSYFLASYPQDRRDPRRRATTLNNKTTMKTTLTTSQAAEILANDENSSFTRAGAFALVEYLEALEDETGEEMDFDSVGLRCDWAEYVSLSDFREEYFADDKQAREAIGADAGDEDDEELDTLTAEYIRDNGELIEFDGGIIVSSF